MAVYFISDLHLEEGRPALTQGFIHFMHTLINNQDAERLYILGDFFEIWIGDDFTSPFVEQITATLRQVADAGTDVFFMHGNRDFLVGETFCQQSHITLLPDPSIITLGEQNILLMHGDSLCTDDVGYMNMRQLFRNPAWQVDILSKSLEERLAFARQVRNESQSDQQMKSADIMDVNQQEVDREMSEHNISLFIHGHTHRPDVHRWIHNNDERTRYVLGDWSDTTGWMIKWEDNSGLELTDFSLTVSE